MVENKEIKKDSFLMYKNWWLDIFEKLTIEERGEVITAVFEFQCYGVEPDWSKYKEHRLLEVAFNQMQRIFLINEEKYIDRVEKNRENGAKGGKAKAEKQDLPENTEKKTTVPVYGATGVKHIGAPHF